MNQHHSALGKFFEKQNFQGKICWICIHLYTKLIGSKSNFSGKITIVSSITIFRPIFSGILEKKLSELFFSQSTKTYFGLKWPFFWYVRSNLGKIEFFLKKGLWYLLPILPPNFMPNFRTKIIGAVSEINSWLTI